MFDCSTCTEEELESVASPECSACHMSQCQTCLDELGVCVPCKEE